MPWGHRSLPDGKVEVYRKDTGKRTGVTTKAKLKSYLAALHIHEGLEGGTHGQHTSKY
jgi:hypothetical protein